MTGVVLFVSTPCYGGICLQAYAESMLRLQRTCAANGIQMMLDTTENESLVHRARNLAVARFYQKTQATHFLFVDADVHFDPESVMRLIKSGHEVSCAAYPKKCVMWDSVEQHLNAGGQGKDLARVASSLVMNFKYQQTQIRDGFAEVLDGPTGFLLIKREVFTKMHEKFPELKCVNDHQMGGQIFADVMTVLGHVGNIRFQGSLEERLRTELKA